MRYKDSMIIDSNYISSFDAKVRSCGNWYTRKQNKIRLPCKEITDYKIMA
jgi:hypothetical protein